MILGIGIVIIAALITMAAIYFYEDYRFQKEFESAFIKELEKETFIGTKIEVPKVKQNLPQKDTEFFWYDSEFDLVFILKANQHDDILNQKNINQSGWNGFDYIGIV